MTEEKAVNALKNCQKDIDSEGAHIDADDILCALLKALGYGDVVSEHRKVRRFFA